MEKQEQQEGRGVTPAKVIEEWAVTDMDRIYIVHDTKERAERHCEKLKGDWTDPKVVPHTTIVGEKAWPESKVKDMMNELIDSGESITDNPWKVLRIAKVYDIAKRHGLTL